MALRAQRDKARNQFKFGIQVPDNPKHAYLLDKLNGNTKWADSIYKELEEVDWFEVFTLLPK